VRPFWPQMTTFFVGQGQQVLAGLAVEVKRGADGGRLADGRAGVPTVLDEAAVSPSHSLGGLDAPFGGGRRICRPSEVSRVPLGRG
jgi:hypothetical protein